MYLVKQLTRRRFLKSDGSLAASITHSPSFDQQDRRPAPSDKDLNRTINN